MLRRVLLSATVWAIAGASASAADLVDEYADGGAGGGLNGPLPGASVNLNQIQEAFNEAKVTANVMRVQYDRRKAPRVRMREYMATLFVLPPGEVITAYSVGDDTNFHVAPLEGEQRNMASVRAEYPGADTNLSLIGKSGRIYPFYLRVDSVDSEHMPAFVVYVEAEQPAVTPAAKLEAPEGAEAAGGGEQAGDAPKAAEKAAEALPGEYLESIPNVDPTAVSCEYEVSDSDSPLAPLRICDDGRWTYFRIHDEDLDLAEQVPVVYQVVGGYDTPVNTRVVDGVIIAETKGGRWTLRAGENHVCVRSKD